MVFYLNRENLSIKILSRLCSTLPKFGGLFYGLSSTPIITNHQPDQNHKSDRLLLYDQSKDITFMMLIFNMYNKKVYHCMNHQWFSLFWLFSQINIIAIMVMNEHPV